MYRPNNVLRSLSCCLLSHFKFQISGFLFFSQHQHQHQHQQQHPTRAFRQEMFVKILGVSTHIS